jgi:hypothetical protein
MTALAIAFLSALLVLTTANGIRMMRDDGTEQIFGNSTDVVSNIDSQRPTLRLIDALGLRAQRALRRLYGPVRLRALDKRLRSAGNPEGLTLDLFIQREAGFIALSLILLILFILIGYPLYGLISSLVFSGWMYLWLLQSLRARQSAIDRDLPDFLDVLAVVVHSGLSFRSALERVCDNFDGPVSEEMLTTLHEMRLGVSRRDAFTATKERCRSENIETFVTALLQSEELGTPIGEALAAIVKEIRRERAQQVKRAASKAQPKVSLVASITMVPGTIILMMGGMLYANRDVFSSLFGG